jgi:hypothetical protein
MQFDSDDIKEILTYIESAETFRPIVDKALDTIKSFGPQFQQIADIFDNIRKQIVKGSIASFEEFQKAGFNREEAMLLTIDTKMAFLRIMQQNKKREK